MSQTVSPDMMLKTRGVFQQVGAYVVAAAFERGGARVAFALGDGSVRIAPKGASEWESVSAHDGAALSLAPDATESGWISGGDDGKFVRIREGIKEVASFGSKWVEHVASSGDAKSRLLACSVGKFVHLYDGAGEKLKSLEHPSSVSGLCFDAKGKRVCASHYNGASLWFVGAKTDTPRKLEWKGSHTEIAISPDGDAVVTAMQENALHGW